MGLQKCGLNLNHTKKELRPHGTLAFPCAGYSEKHTDKTEDIIPWHWHDEIEITYVKSGTLNIQVPAKSVLPLISNSSFDGYLLKPGNGKKLISDFNNAFDALADDTFGFEFIVREKLSKIFLFLYQQYRQELMPENTALNQDNLRIGKMIDFIHNNFSNNLTLTDIAKTTDISERECLRCFQRTIQISPMQYLLKYRIMQGADFLMKNPASSISEVAAFSGFDSPSNFTKMFKRFYNCTPREYRNNF